MTDEQKSKCHKIAEHYGEEHQMLKAVEEMAELTQAILKLRNYEISYHDYLKELADVTIMIGQLKYINYKSGNHGLLGTYINEKLDRQLKRMESENDDRIYI
jgi:NTP pyrophosphatase (non-canonical NTP hydrolase)